MRLETVCEDIGSANEMPFVPDCCSCGVEGTAEVVVVEAFGSGMENSTRSCLTTSRRSWAEADSERTRKKNTYVLSSNLWINATLTGNFYSLSITISKQQGEIMSRVQSLSDNIVCL